MSFKNFLDEAGKGLASGNYLLISSDRFLHTEAVSIIKNLIPEGERDFNFQAFDIQATDSDKTSFEQILDVLNTIPFFIGRKFVIVENFQKLLKKEMKKLEQYLENPSPSSVLVLLNEGALKKDVKESLKGIKQIILDIREQEIPAWIKGKGRLRGIDISDTAAEYLLGIIGPELGMLSSEIDKLTLLGKTSVNKEDIVDIVEGKRTYNAFALIDAIRAKNTEEAFRIYSIIKETEEPYSLLGALNWEYSRILGTGDSPEGRVYSHAVFSLLNKADLDIKSSGGSYPVELLIIKLIRLSRQR